MTDERPRRFCMVTTFYPPYHFGGDAVFVHHLSNELARRGHRVEVVHCLDAYRLLARGGGAGREPTRGYDDHPNVTVHGLSSPFGFLSPLATHQTGLPLFKAGRLRRVLDAGAFDVIHYHNVSLVGGPGVLALGRAAVKLYTMHEYWLGCQTHVLYRNNAAPCDRRTCLTCSLAHRRPPQLWRYTNLLADAVGHVDAFIAPSRFSEQMHRRMGLRGRIVHIPDFVTDAVADADAPPGTSGSTAGPTDDAAALDRTSGGPPYFLFVGRLERLKGLHTLLPLFRHLPEARLLVTGTGGEERALRQQAEGLPNVVFLGHLPPGELPRLYRQAVALVLPSDCYEVAGLVVPEAALRGTPSIVRNRGGMPEIIVRGGGGYAYDGDGELLAAMRRLLANRGLRDALGRRARELCLREWTPDVHLARYFALVDEITAAKRSGAADAGGMAEDAARRPPSEAFVARATVPPPVART
jgi:glycosyltransferase involved in cell wall biosynthesis